MSILGDAKNRLKSSGITYPGWEERTDDYGNRVAPGGIRNYRMPSFGGTGVIGGGSAEAECIARGGTWNPATQQCILPGGESTGAEPGPGKTVTDAYGNQLPIIHPGDPNFSDPAGTHLNINDLPDGFTAQDVIDAGGLVDPNHDKIPAPGEVYAQIVNGRPILVVESSNPGNTVAPTTLPNASLKP